MQTKEMPPESNEQIEKLFFEVFETLPRQGPGSPTSTERALNLCLDLPSSPSVLDLGCGTGAQTFHLAELTKGKVFAVDIYSPNIERLQEAVTEQNLGKRIQPVIGDISQPKYEPESFDLIWSEGALYNIGIEEALHLYHRILKPGGYFAFTEAVWCKENPPPEVKASFEEYAAMGWVQDVLEKIDRSDFNLVGHYSLPDEDWWNDFYSPMERQIEKLRKKYAGDPKSLGALDQIAQEPEMHRRYSDYYGYEFFVVRRG